MGELYNKLLDLNVLYDAYIKCQKNVHWKASVQRYGINVFAELHKLKKSLENHTYKQKPFFEFDLNERGKIRHIKALDISDRVLQRALCDNILTPVIRRYVIYDNGASLSERGITFSRKRIKVLLQKYFRKYGNEGYALLIDFSKYFESIPHQILLDKFKKVINDREVINLLEYLLKTFEKGVGIGAQISQSAGVFYPTEIDNYCKNVKRCKYYERYNDDTVIIHKDRQFLQKLLTEYKELTNKLGLSINDKKTQIVPLKNGFTILKMRYLISDTGKINVIPCRKTFKREREKIKKLSKMELYRLRPKGLTVEQYRGWRGNIRKYNCYQRLRNMDRLVYNLTGVRFGKYGFTQKERH